VHTIWSRLWTKRARTALRPAREPHLAEIGPDVQVCCLDTTSTVSRFNPHCGVTNQQGTSRQPQAGLRNPHPARTRHRAAVPSSEPSLLLCRSTGSWCGGCQVGDRPDASDATTVEAEQPSMDLGAAATERHRPPRSRPYGVAQPRRSRSHGPKEQGLSQPPASDFNLTAPRDLEPGSGDVFCANADTKRFLKTG
jgi:hypothetical protein